MYETVEGAVVDGTEPKLLAALEKQEDFMNIEHCQDKIGQAVAGVKTQEPSVVSGSGHFKNGDLMGPGEQSVHFAPLSARNSTVPGIDDGELSNDQYNGKDNLNSKRTAVVIPTSGNNEDDDDDVDDDESRSQSPEPRSNEQSNPE